MLPSCPCPLRGRARPASYFRVGRENRSLTVCLKATNYPTSHQSNLLLPSCGMWVLRGSSKERVGSQARECPLQTLTARRYKTSQFREPGQIQGANAAQSSHCLIPRAFINGMGLFRPRIHSGGVFWV